MGTLINQTGLSALDFTNTHNQTHNLKQLLLSLFHLAIPTMQGGIRICQHTNLRANRIFIRCFLIPFVSLATMTQVKNCHPSYPCALSFTLKSLRSLLRSIKKLLKSYLSPLHTFESSRHTRHIFLIKEKQKVQCST